MNVAAIITAAGLGKRMGGGPPKQFIKIDGRPLILHALGRFEASRCVGSIVVVAEPSMVRKMEGVIRGGGLSKEWVVVAGGEHRQDSVRNGLGAVPGDTEIVVVHDGVRPFISPEVIDRSVEVAREAGGCIVAIPVSDTIKRCSEDGHVGGTVDRSDLWAAQTPQTFRYEILKEAYDRAYGEGFYGTDEAALVSRIGRPIRLLEGSSLNIKVTTPEDISIAEAICKVIARV